MATQSTPTQKLISVLQDIEDNKNLKSAFEEYDKIKQENPDLVEKYTPQFNYYDSLRNMMGHRINETGYNIPEKEYGVWRTVPKDIQDELKAGVKKGYTVYWPNADDYPTQQTVDEDWLKSNGFVFHQGHDGTYVVRPSDGYYMGAVPAYVQPSKKAENGITYTAKVDQNTGELLGYTSDASTWVAPKTHAAGVYSATGMPQPNIWKSKSSGFFSGLVQDLGPIGQIGMAIATGGLSIPQQLAAMTAYNMVGGQDFDDALKGAALGVGVSQGIQGLTGGAEFGGLDAGPGAYDISGYLTPEMSAGLAGGAGAVGTGGIDDLLTGYENLGSGAGGDYGISPAGALSDIGLNPADYANLGSGAGGDYGMSGAANLGSLDPADYTGLGSGAGGDYGIQTPGAVNLGSMDPADYENLGSGAGGNYGIETPGLVNLGSMDPADYENLGSGAGGNYGIETPGLVNLGSTDPADYENLGSGAGGNYGIETPGIVNLGSMDPADYENLGSGAGGDYGIGAAGAAAGLGAAGAAGAGMTAAEALKYAGLASLAASVLGGGQSSGDMGPGPDNTPIGAGLSKTYKPYEYKPYAMGGGIQSLAAGGGYHLGDYSDGGRLLRGPGDGVSDDIPATIGGKQPARLADGEFVIPARIVSELGNGSTDAGARKLYAMMDRVQSARRKTMGKKKFAENTKADKHLPA